MPRTATPILQSTTLTAQARDRTQCQCPFRSFSPLLSGYLYLLVCLSSSQYGRAAAAAPKACQGPRGGGGSAGQVVPCNQSAVAGERERGCGHDRLPVRQQGSIQGLLVHQRGHLLENTKWGLDSQQVSPASMASGWEGDGPTGPGEQQQCWLKVTLVNSRRWKVRSEMKSGQDRLKLQSSVEGRQH
eukprot:2655400-Rhodomonas_salina.1